MDSKLKLPALKVARWALKHGEFFELYDVSYLLGIPSSDASQSGALSEIVELCG